MTLEMEDLTVRYEGAAAVDGLGLTVPTGSVLAVLGPSGCGKSTLLRAIAGLERPSSGHIAWDGEDLAGVPTHRRGFALMFQDGQLFPGQDVARNIGYPLRVRHLDRVSIRDRVAELLDLVGLTDLADRLPAQLSGGERQRVALARALAVSPRLLLLDEPLSALDRDLREGLALQLRDILAAAGTTAIMVTHDQEEAFAVADAIALMREGRLVQHGTLAEVWGAPANAWAARFLGYPTVLTGRAADAVRAIVDPDARWTEVALRRSALRVDPRGPLEATVLAVRATPDLTRVDLEAPALGDGGPGVVAAVAPPGAEIAPGAAVRIGVDGTRLAPVGRRGGPAL